MKRYAVAYDLEARRDLQDQFDFVLEQSGAERAIEFVDRIEAFIANLGQFPELGKVMTVRPTTIRAIAFKRQVNIIYAFDGSQVLVLRVFARGRDGLSWLADLPDNMPEL